MVNGQPLECNAGLQTGCCVGLQTRAAHAFAANSHWRRGRRQYSRSGDRRYFLLRRFCRYRCTLSGSALAVGNCTLRMRATVGAIWRMSTMPRSRWWAMPGPAAKKDERISG